MAKKKVTYVITKSNWGGAQRYVFDLATNLNREEFEVSVALGGTGGKQVAMQDSVDSNGDTIEPNPTGKLATKVWST